MAVGQVQEINASRSNGLMVLGLTSAGSFLVHLSGGIMPLAVPSIMREFPAETAALGTTPTIVWTLIAYMITFAAVLVPAAKLADVYGHKLFFSLGLVIFTAFGILSGAAWSIASLLLFRFLQGIGGGMVFVVSMQLLGNVYPSDTPESATALGVWRGFVVGASVLAPAVGGPLTVWLGWRWVSWALVPIAAVVWILSLMWLKKEEQTTRSQPFDWTGSVLTVASFSLLAVAMAGTRIFGATSTNTLLLYGGFVVISILLVLVERTVRAPVLNLSLFRNLPYMAASVATWIVCVGMCAVMMFVLFFMLYIQKYQIIPASIAVIPASITAIVFSYVGGYLTNKWGLVIPSVLGFLLVAAGFLLLTNLSPQTPYSQILAALVLTGIGMSLPLAPTTVAAIRAVSKGQIADASGLLNTFHNLGRPTGVGVLGSFLVVTSVSSYNSIFLWAAIVSLIGAVASFGMRIKQHGAP
ncbi:MAG: MFS transporter [Alphaproteobacteria bacterium]|nr:MFS transporter [Alphaproteobacteria bacterium]